MAIHYYEQEVPAKLKEKKKLSNFLFATVKSHLQEVTSVSLNFIFCSDAHLLQINKDYLQHDTLTDIITFDLSESPKKMLGEIYISIERIHENAVKFNTSYNEELHRVIFHGVLHLCGFKDKSTKDQALMRAKENECLQQYFQATT
jgi:rRNA maturation RNase YbeY